MPQDTSWKKEFDLKFGRMIIPGIKDFVQTLLNDQIVGYQKVITSMKEKHMKKEASLLRVIGALCYMNEEKRVKVPFDVYETLPENFTLMSYQDDVAKCVVFHIDEEGEDPDAEVTHINKSHS